MYNISKNFNLALQIQPQVLTFLSLVTFAQVKYYKAVRFILLVSLSRPLSHSPSRTELTQRNAEPSAGPSPAASPPSPSSSSCSARSKPA